MSGTGSLTYRVVDPLLGVVPALALLVFLSYEVTITAVGAWEWDEKDCPQPLVAAVHYGRPGPHRVCP